MAHVMAEQVNMLTRKQIQDLATETVREHGMLLVLELAKGEQYDGGNLCALLELFAQKLDAVKSPDIIGIIDARLGEGWTRRLAEAVSK